MQTTIAMAAYSDVFGIEIPGSNTGFTNGDGAIRMNDAIKLAINMEITLDLNFARYFCAVCNNCGGERDI